LTTSYIFFASASNFQRSGLINQSSILEPPRETRLVRIQWQRRDLLSPSTSSKFPVELHHLAPSQGANHRPEQDEKHGNLTDTGGPRKKRRNHLQSALKALHPNTLQSARPPQKKKQESSSKDSKNKDKKTTNSSNNFNSSLVQKRKKKKRTLNFEP
jgi:hypothetical protein